MGIYVLKLLIGREVKVETWWGVM